MADVDISKIQLPDGTGCNLKDATARSAASAAYTAATTVANGSDYGVVKLSASVSSTSGTSGGVAATPSAVRSAYNLADSAYDLADAAYDDGTRIGDDTTRGQVKLSDSVNSSSDVDDGVAATPYAVKTVNDSLTDTKKQIYLSELPYKNLLENTHEHNSSTYNGITYNNSFFYGGSITDCRVAVNGEVPSSASGGLSYFDVNTSLTLEPGTYILTGCPSGGSSTTYRLRAHLASDPDTMVADDTGSGYTFTLTQTTEIGVRIYIYPAAGEIHKAFYPMICTKFLYDINSAYVPFTKRIGRVDQYGVVKLSDSTSSTSGEGNGIAATPWAVKSAYDLANTANTAAGTAQTTINTIREATGVITGGNLIPINPVRDDCSELIFESKYGESGTTGCAVSTAFHVYGTVSQNHSYDISAGVFWLYSGTYRLTGCPHGNSVATYEIRVINTNTNATIASLDNGGSITFTTYNQQAVIVKFYVNMVSRGTIDTMVFPVLHYLNDNQVYSTTHKETPNTFVATDKMIGCVKLSDSTSLDSDEKSATAATPKAVKQVYDIAYPKGASNVYGRVLLYDGVDSDNGASSNIAATPKAVKKAYDDGTAKAGLSTYGQVKLSDDPNSAIGVYAQYSVAATPYAVQQVRNLAVQQGNASTQGQVKLSASTSSTSGVSDGIAATPSAVKSAYDRASAGMLYKNLLCVRHTESSYVYKNIHYDVVSNQSVPDCGYIYVYGNNNGAASDTSYYVVNDRQVYLDPGTYILTGCPSGGSTTTYRLRAHNIENAEVAIADDVGNGSTFTVASRIAVQVRIYIYPAAGAIPSSSKKLFCPMICLKSAYDADSSFVPGRSPIGTDAVYGMVKLTDTADVDHDAYEGIAASATAVHKAYSLADTANTAASTANTSLANKVQTLGYQTGTSPYLYYNKDGSSTKTSFCSMATSVTSGNSYPVTSGAVYTYLNNNYYDSDDVDDVISDRPQVVYSKAASKATSTTLSEISGLSYTTSGSYYYRITASLCWNATGCKAKEVRLIARSSSGATGYCYARAVSDGTVDMGTLTCTALVYQMSRIFSVQVKSAASGNNIVSLLVEKIPMNIT